MVRGLGHKPSSNMSSNMFGAQPQTPQPFSELDSYLAAKGKQAANDDDDDNLFDKDDEDDDEY
ncbi:hypothetical protein HanIR_Chr10g0499561 [Helianthus annuus]|nr:hypothetical protein HanIR_Chr10g0499561 [Helianthus annuus]